MLVATKCCQHFLLRQLFTFTALFRPTSLHVFVSFITHRAVLFAAGSAGFFAFVDVSNQIIFGHVVSKIFFKFDAKYVRFSCKMRLPTKALRSSPTTAEGFFMIASTSYRSISISPVTGAEVSLGF